MAKWRWLCRLIWSCSVEYKCSWKARALRCLWSFLVWREPVISASVHPVRHRSDAMPNVRLSIFTPITRDCGISCDRLCCSCSRAVCGARSHCRVGSCVGGLLCRRQGCLQQRWRRGCCRCGLQPVVGVLRCCVGCEEGVVVNSWSEGMQGRGRCRGRQRPRVSGQGQSCCTGREGRPGSSYSTALYRDSTKRRGFRKPARIRGLLFVYRSCLRRARLSVSPSLCSVPLERQGSSSAMSRRDRGSRTGASFYPVSRWSNASAAMPPHVFAGRFRSARCRLVWYRRVFRQNHISQRIQYRCENALPTCGFSTKWTKILNLGLRWSLIVEISLISMDWHRNIRTSPSSSPNQRPILLLRDV